MSTFTEMQAIAIWKEIWLGATKQSQIIKHAVNPHRVYEVLSEKKNQGSRLKAMAEFSLERPELIATTDFSPHVEKRRVVMKHDNDQGSLFADVI